MADFLNIRHFQVLCKVRLHCFHSTCADNSAKTPTIREMTH